MFSKGQDFLAPEHIWALFVDHSFGLEARANEVL
jgi:hypothetical protein